MRRAGSRIPSAAACAVVLALVAALLGGCMPQPATSEGSDVKGLYDLFLVIAAFVFAIVAGLIGWSIVRYRARPGDGPPPQIKDNPKLELVWWAIPTVLVIGLFIVTAQVLSRVDARSPNPAVRVTVTGSQWQWRFEYQGTGVVLQGLPDDPPQLVLPVGETVAFDLVSADVVHSFWVPDFLIKRDVVPGRTNHLEMTIDDVGTYRGTCGEFCGLLHSRMTFSINAMAASDFNAWLARHEAGQSSAPPASSPGGAG